MRPRLFGLAVMIITALALLAGPAFGKVLPITDLRVTTHTPTVHHPIRVLLRLDPASGVGHLAVTHGEVRVLPAREADADGWPVRRSSGRAVVLRRRRDGSFGGAFVVAHPGRYVVVARSSYDAHTMLEAGVANVWAELPPPVTVTVTG